MTARASILCLRRSGAGLLLAALLCLSPVCLSPAHAQRGERAIEAIRTNSLKVLTAFREVVAQPSESTVRVLCDDKKVALGTIVESDGWIVTKYSELRGSIKCELKDGRVLSARLVGADEAYDLAMLKVEARGLKKVAWADVKSAVPGNWVATPGNGNNPLAVGVVSVAARKVTARDLPISLSTAFLGIVMEPAETGVRIKEVMRNSAASKANLKVDDVILAVAGWNVEDLEAMQNRMRRYQPGEVVTFRIKRGDEELEIKATLTRRPPGDRSDFQNRLGSELSPRRGGFPSVLQHDTVLGRHDCGGPLVDLDGKALGINIARAGRTETYTAPADAVLALLPDLKAGKLQPVEVRETLARLKAAQDKAVKAKAALDKALAERDELARKAKIDDKEKAEADKRIKEARAALEKVEAEVKALNKD